VKNSIAMVARVRCSSILLLATCFVPLLFISTLRAQDQVQAPAAQTELHWAIKLGVRSHQVSQAFPLVDRVVLVPDAATYVSEIAKWSPANGRWPVLFDETRFASMFIRRFKPAEVLRVDSVGAFPATKREREELLRQAVIASWGGDPSKQSLHDVFEHHRFTPMGVVVTSVDDTAWTAGVALAAGHGQPLLFLDGRFGEDRGIANENLLGRFVEQLEALVAPLPYSHRALGDDLDAITICRGLAARTRRQLPGNDDMTGFSVTDAIGRNADQSRWAFTGWIFGEEARCAYVAMSSLFLDRTEALLVNTYPNENEWGVYGLHNVEPALSSIGFRTTHYHGSGASADAWSRLLPGGITADVVLFNSKGMREFFDMATGRAYAVDVPVLNTPAAVHFIHSFSMFNPSDTTTVAGRWIAHGAYAYVGSVVEPSLGGFVPPMVITERLMNFVPFLVAVRHWDAPRSNPAKIATYGDPLMLVTRPEKAAHPRIIHERTDGVNLQDRTRELMTAIKDSPTAEAYAEAIRNLVLLGKDEIAAELWSHAVQSRLGDAAADQALGALFRLRKRGEFMQAWDRLRSRTELDEDMLWHLWSGQMSGADEDTLLHLQSAVRAGQPEIDLGRLLPVLERAFGSAHAQRVIDRALESASDENSRKKLRELRRRS